jgi:hypothetical protein
MVVGDLALRLERREHRSAVALRQRDHVVHGEARAVADDDHRAPRRAQSFGCVREGAGGRCELAVGHATCGAGDRSIGRERLHLVGQHEVADTRGERRLLGGERGELGGFRVGQQGARPRCHAAERGSQVELLEVVDPEYARRDLAGQRDDRRAVDVGVPPPGEQVRRPAAGDRQARGGAGP